MSDVSHGQGWWIASDGKWYPPELHPSAQSPAAAATAARAQTTAAAVSAAPAATSGAVTVAAPAEPERGPRFPDLFERARHANAVADAVRIRTDGAAGPDDFVAPTGAVSATRHDKRRRRR